MTSKNNPKLLTRDAFCATVFARDRHDHVVHRDGHWTSRAVVANKLGAEVPIGDGP